MHYNLNPQSVEIYKMNQNDQSSLSYAIDKIKDKMGKQNLSDDDALILSINQIIHTYTYEEKKYTS
jgi:hypothetical protein